MAFEKGNTHGKGRPKGSLNKKTIIKNSLEKINEVGLTPLDTSKEIIDSLLNNKEIDINQKIKLLSVTTNLIKYELLTMSEIANLDEVILENEKLKEENEILKSNFVGTTQDLLKKLKKEEIIND